MPQVLEQPTLHVSSPYRIRWTRDDCDDFEKRGLLTPGKYELIEGEIIQEMGQKRPHSAGISRLFAWAIRVFGDDFVQSQATIDVSPEDNPTSAPEPDLYVLNRSIENFPVEYPRPSDLVLVVEVSDTTLAFDLATKAGLYARAGIPEYWALDVTGRSLITHRDPQDGRYQSVVRYAADERVFPLARPDITVVVSALLPPMAS